MNRRNPLIALIAISMVLSSAVTAYTAGITIPASSTINVNTGTLTVPGDISILTGGALQGTTGTITLTGNLSNGGTLTTAGPLWCSGNIACSGNGTINQTAQYTVMQGSTSKTITNTGTGTITFYKFEENSDTNSGSTAKTTISCDISVGADGMYTNNWNNAGDGYFIIDTGVTVTVAGVYYNKGKTETKSGSLVKVAGDIELDYYIAGTAQNQAWGFDTSAGGTFEWTGTVADKHVWPNSSSNYSRFYDFKKSGSSTLYMEKYPLYTLNDFTVTAGTCIEISGMYIGDAIGDDIVMTGGRLEAKKFMTVTGNITLSNTALFWGTGDGLPTVVTFGGTFSCADTSKFQAEWCTDEFGTKYFKLVGSSVGSKNQFTGSNSQFEQLLSGGPPAICQVYLDNIYLNLTDTLTRTAAQKITLAGDCQFNAITLNGDANTIFDTGAYTATVGGAFTNTFGTVTIGSGGAINAGSYAFTSDTANSTVATSGALTCGNLTIGSALGTGTFTNTAANTISSSGDVVITVFGATTTNDTLTLTGDGKYINASVDLGNLINNGGTDVSKNYISTNNLTLDGTFTNNSSKYFTTLDGASSRNLTTGDTSGGTIDIDGPFYANNSTITIKGNGDFDVNGQANFTAGTSTVDLQGTSTIIGNSNWITFYSLTCGAAGKTTSINTGAAWTGIDVYETLTVGTGALQESIANQKILLYSATASNSGTIDVQEFEANTGTSSINGGNFADSEMQVTTGGTLNLTGSVTSSGNWKVGYWTDNTTNILNLNGNNITCSGWFAAGDSNGAKPGCVGQVTCGAGSIAVGSDMHIYSRINGADTSSINLGSGTHTIPNELHVTGANASLTLSSATTTVGGSFANEGTVGTVIANGGTVIFNDNAKTSTISGTTSFYNLTCTTAGKTLNFDAEIPTNNYRTNITNLLNFSGSLGSLITLARSGGTGTDQWAINPAGNKGLTPGWTVAYVSVSNSVNLNDNCIYPDTSTDGGNNTNWFSPTLVKLTAFYAIGYFGKVAIHWKTASEYNNAGFNLYVSENSEGPYTKLNSALIPGLGTSTTGREYSYADSNVVNGKTYYYKLEDVEFNGRTQMHGPVKAHPGLDSDGDGMTDDWEIHYGLNPYDPSDALLDLDGDGLTNLEEFQQDSDPTKAPDGMRILSSDETGITFELTTSKFEAIPKQVGEIIYQELKIPEYEHGYTDEPGKPQMPLKVVPLGIPQGMSAIISSVDFDMVEDSGYNIYPVPNPPPEVDKGLRRKRIFEGKDGLKIKGLDFNNMTSQENSGEEFYSSQSQYYPAQIVDIFYEGDMRGQRLVYVNSYPLTFDSIGHNLRFYKRIRVTLQFKNAPIKPPVNPSGHFGGYSKVKICTTQEGLYRLGWDALWNAGFYDISWLDPRTLKIYNKGSQIPIRVIGEADGIFNRYDYIEFYAQRNDSKYSKENVYWLTHDKEGGIRMEDISSSAGVPVATPDRFFSTVHMENNDFYWGERKGPEDVDRWLWNSYIWAGTKVDYPAVLKNINLLHPEDEAKIKVAYYALFNVSHHSLVYLNGKLINESLWSGQDEHVVDTQVPQSDLLADGNTISIETRLSQGVQYDLLLPNYFEVSYRRNFVADGDTLDFSYKSNNGGVTQFNITGFTTDNLELFDITDIAAVKYITGFEVTYQADGSYSMGFKYDFKPDEERRFLAIAQHKKILADNLNLDNPSDLSSQRNRADYIVISYGAFKNSLWPLKILYTSKGLRIKIVDVEDVYDEFNYGIESPHAIKDFLNYAYNKWQHPVPTYVLLVGDATYDYRDNLGTGKINYVPAYLFPDTPYLGETASDNWFVCLDGPDDILPDMFIGRIPAGNNSEVKNVVKKILDYNRMPRKYFSKKITFTADDEEHFEDISNNLIGYLPKWSTPVKLYLADYSNYPQFTQDIINSINNGTLLLSYVGHGSTNLWTEEELFNTSTADLLTNYRKYPFVNSFTCLDGYFLSTEERFRSLAEVFLIKRDAGAVACFSPTGMGLPDGHKMLSEELFKAIFLDGKYRLGPATTQAKLNLFSRVGTQYQDLIHTYTLFGDPALSLKIPVRKRTVPPIIVSQKVLPILKGALSQGRPEEPPEDEFGEVLKKFLLNYKESKEWKDRSKESNRPRDEDENSP